MLAVLNRVAAQSIAAIIGFMAAITFAMSGSWFALIFFFLAPPLAVAIHELGHAIAAWRLGMNVIAISVGPLVLRFKPLRIRPSDELLGPDVGGYVLYEETHRHPLTRKANTIITLAGPAANLACVVIAFAVARYLPESIAMLVGGFGFASFAAFLLSAWPFELASGRGNDTLEVIRDLPRRPRVRRAPNKRSPWQAP